jgi:hypothetical protein
MRPALGLFGNVAWIADTGTLCMTMVLILLVLVLVHVYRMKR